MPASRGPLLRSSKHLIDPELLSRRLVIAARLRAGVPTELHVNLGAYHGFGIAADAQIAEAAQHSSITALRRALDQR